ncbi:EI24 domain-containing protein [Lampropedia cohaerens]|uniref:EI24 domain-containing protein n=1 Tax=Lampropedia cohaerens TaxID=1610491 RepID=UPI0018D1FB73|nr:EI24 domain-containing protein [Lampropedia cohaerens]
MLQSFWRALVDSFRPRVIALSLLPLGIIIVAAVVLGWLYWGEAVARVAGWMQASSIWTWVDGRLIGLGVNNATEFLAPVLVIMLVTPVLIIVALLLVTLFMTPLMANDVAARRFPNLQRRGGKQVFWRSLGWSLLSTLAAFAALVVTLPLWLVPPLALVVPPLIWGWLAYRVLSFDALAQHATVAERQVLLAQHRWPLLVIGVACGFLGATPSLVWASGVVFAVAFPVLIPVAVWLFTWVFAFTSLWYAHYCLRELARLRGPQGQDLTPTPSETPPAQEAGKTPSAAEGAITDIDPAQPRLPAARDGGAATSEE